MFTNRKKSTKTYECVLVIYYLILLSVLGFRYILTYTQLHAIISTYSLAACEENYYIFLAHFS